MVKARLPRKINANLIWNFLISLELYLIFEDFIQSLFVLFLKETKDKSKKNSTPNNAA